MILMINMFQSLQTRRSHLRGEEEGTNRQLMFYDTVLIVTVVKILNSGKHQIHYLIPG
jgi:hypothetical protein